MIKFIRYTERKRGVEAFRVNSLADLLELPWITSLRATDCQRRFRAEVDFKPPHSLACTLTVNEGDFIVRTPDSQLDSLPSLTVVRAEEFTQSWELAE
jgi:hypothetical protein